MSIYDKAQKDWKRFSQENDLTFKTLDPLNEVTVKGLSSKIHLSVDEEGKPINSLNAQVTVSESLLTDAGYVVRNGKDQVSMHGQTVKFKDIRGTEKEYFIQEHFPDETTGVITFIIGNYAP